MFSVFQYSDTPLFHYSMIYIFHTTIASVVCKTYFYQVYFCNRILSGVKI